MHKPGVLLGLSGILLSAVASFGQSGQTLPEVVVRAPKARPSAQPSRPKASVAQRARVPRAAPRTAARPTPLSARAPVVAARRQPEARSPAPQTPAADTLAALGTDGTLASAALGGQNIQRAPLQTIGDALFTQPGVTGTTFAPGAASRPVVRGLEGPRVRIQENGIGSQGVSDLGEDHAVPVDPLAAEKVEVLRGPATLRYSSQAIGGVVSAENNRIPTVLPEQGVHGELRGALTSVNRGTDGAVLLDAGAGKVAVHADAFDNRGSDYRIPGGTQPNTSFVASGQSVGSSYFFDQGYAGVAIQHFASLYHVPGTEAAANNTRIDLDQVKVTSKGEWRPNSDLIQAFRFWFGASDYKHNELGRDENGVDGVRATFKNQEQEGRFEVQHAPVATGIGVLNGFLGFQYIHRNVRTAGEAGGLLAPAEVNRAALYDFEELRVTDTVRLQAAGRIERSKIDGTAVTFPPGLLPDGGEPTEIKRSLGFTPISGSIALLKDLPFGVVASVTGDYKERAPDVLELFARGAHDATGTFEIGDANLRKEAAKTVELSFRRPVGDWRFEANAYYRRFDGFIFRQFTGVRCGGEFTTCGDPAGEFLQVVYSQKDAVFRGAELTSALDLWKVWGGTFGVDGRFDFVRAQFTDGTNVPRIPPYRLGGGLYWRDGAWSARVGLLHAFAHTETGVNETPTPGYNLLRAELSYTHRITAPKAAFREVTLGIVGDNLLDDVVRNSVSFRKDEVVLPGRSVRVFANARF